MADCTEKLYSRLEQQSGIICMLKQRNDRTLLELSEATSKYQVNCQHMEKLQQSLAEEMGQRRLLEKRFQDLADNHQQMIRLKDEYKEEARGLREKVGRQEQGHRRSLELEEDMLRVQRECEEKLKSFEERLTAVQAEKDTAQSKAHQLQQKTNEAAREHVCAIQHLQMSLKESEEEAASARHDCQRKRNEIVQLDNKLSQLNTELQLVTSKLKDANIKIDSLEAEMLSLKMKESARAEKLSKDAVVCTLRSQLEENQQDLMAIKKEYSAYKAHSTELLAHERKLNEKLRHLLE